jgi:hypothetical protein
MSCEIIQFSTVARPTRPVSDRRPLGQRMREAKPALPPTATETAKNSRIRAERREAWWLARMTADYWHARLKWRNELATAQRFGIGDSTSFPPPVSAGPFDDVDMWRQTVAKQLLTPSPTLGDVAWKRAKIKSDDFKQLPITLTRAEQAIADDVAFLDAHPTRTKKGAPL